MRLHQASDPIIYLSFASNVARFTGLSANETFCVVFLSAVVMIWDEAAQSLSALFTRVNNQNALWDLQNATCILVYIFTEGWALCCSVLRSVHLSKHIIAAFCSRWRWLFVSKADAGSTLPDTCSAFSDWPLILLPRPHQVPLWTCGQLRYLWRRWSGGKPRRPSPLPPEPSGCAEEVASRGGKSAWLWWRGERGRGRKESSRLKITGSLFHNVSVISTRSWGNIAARLRKRLGSEPATFVTESQYWLGRTAHITNSSNSALLASSLCSEINLISVTLLLFIATSTTTSTQMRPKGRR